MYKIVRKETLNELVELMEIHAPYVARKCEPGQFIILRVDEDGERVPLTIADYDREKETVTIIYQVVGYSTKLLSQKKEGEYVQDFVGPLGVPAKLEKSDKKVIGVAGGVGAARRSNAGRRWCRAMWTGFGVGRSAVSAARAV